MEININKTKEIEYSAKDSPPGFSLMTKNLEGKTPFGNIVIHKESRDSKCCIHYNTQRSNPTIVEIEHIDAACRFVPVNATVTMNVTR